MQKLPLYLSAIIYICCISMPCKGQIITTIAGSPTAGYSGDGAAATAALLREPDGLNVDSSGKLYIADYGNHCVRRIDATGIITTIAGTGTAGYTADGVPATTSELNRPDGVAIDLAGNVYIYEAHNYRVRKIDLSGIISTVAGTGTGGYTGDGGAATAAEIYTDPGCVDKFGNIYIADVVTNRLRMINAGTGIISTIAGDGTTAYAGDGLPATAAELNSPDDIASDNSGNLYIVTSNDGRIRKIDSDGIITTIAGTGGHGSTGDGGPATIATFDQPAYAVIDSIGNIYVADQSSNNVRKIDRTGIINLLAGSGTRGYTGDGGPATAAELSAPIGTAVNIYGDVYISDFNNNCVRKISYNNNLPSIRRGRNLALIVCTNDTASIDSLLPITDADAGQTETWTLTVAPRHGTANAGYTATSTGSTVATTGLWYAPAAGYTGNDTFSVRIDDGYSVYTTTIYASIPNCSLGAVNTLQPSDAVKVFPNPNEGTFTIQPSSIGIPTKIVITNAVGSVVKEMTITKATDIKLNVPAGVYTVSATANGNKQAVKMAVE